MDACINCSTCRYWQGKRQQGDCYRVIQVFCPEIFSLDIRSRFGNRVKVPFDPHDIQYHDDESPLFKYYNKIPKTQLPDGVKIENIKTKLFSSATLSEEEKEQPRIQYKIRNLYFFTTNHDFRCELWEKK